MKAILRQIVFLFIGAIIGALFALLQISNNPDLTRYQLFMGFFFLFLSFYLHIFIHEFGHLIAGKMTGYSFISYRVGNLHLKKENGKMVTKRYSIPGTGGQCLMRPPALDDGNYPVIFYNLGGGLLNLIISGAFLLATVTNGADLFLISFGMAGIFAGLTNLIPMNFKIPNDGHNIFNLNKNQLAKRAFWLQMESNALLSAGKKLNDMPARLFEFPADAEPKNTVTLSIPYLKICRLTENEKYGQAKTLYEQFKNEPAFLDLYKLEIQADFLGYDILNDTETSTLQIDKKLIKYLERTPNLLSHSRILYSYFSMVDKNPTKSDYYKRTFYKLVSKYPYPSTIEAENELMQRIEKKLSNKP